MTALLVAIGAAVGAPVRLLVNHALRVQCGATPMAGTLTVNVVGSFLLGLLAGWGVHGNSLALVGVGFCGALTTFSTLALEIWEAFDEGPRRLALINVVASLTLGVGAAALGWSLVA
ncbi:MAG: CrcB family protein [Phycicoccus sp.]|nr:CrcB family protein [Phycicoccus sp.]